MLIRILPMALSGVRPLCGESPCRTVPAVSSAAPSDLDRVRTVEIIGALSLATDLGIRVPLEHGLHSTLVAMRLAERLGVDADTARHTYFACLLFYVGCTAGAETASEVFGDEEALTTHAMPARFGSRPEMFRGLLRAIAPPGNAAPLRAARVVQGLPKAALAFREQVPAFCQVGQMLTGRLGLPESMKPLFAYFPERWDGKGEPARAKGDAIPLPVRIVHVARDAVFQRMLGDNDRAVALVAKRSGGAFDPAVAARLVDHASETLRLDGNGSAWDELLEAEPHPHLELEGEAIDRALAAVSNFADLNSRYLVGHSASVAELAAAAAQRCQLEPRGVVDVRRASLVHDLGRVAVPVAIWNKPGPLTADEWERVRLHAYHSERVLSRSSFLAGLASSASLHHERMDGSGYHRGSSASALGMPARLIAAADAYGAMTEPRPHRHPLTPQEAAVQLTEEARAGRLDADAVAGVLDAAGQPARPPRRPAGLTERESEVIGLLARGLQTKQIAAALSISPKTADHHVQNAYRKIGVSTRAAAAVFAMEHGLVR